MLSKIRTMSVLAILAMMFSFANISSAAAQDATPPGLPGWTIGTGTHFELLDSPYLPVTLDSSVSVTLILSSVPELVDMTIDADAATGSADFTFGGFAPNTLYYHYEDEGLNPVTFTTDDTGSFTITQDLSERHHVWFRAHPSTKYLYDNATGGDCSASLGTWSSAAKTCTLTHNINDAIFIQNNGITLDGAGYQLSAPGNYAVYAYGLSNVTVKNLKVVNSAYGIRLENGSNFTVKDNTVTGPSGYYYGIIVYNSANNSTVTGNSVSGAYYYGIVAGYYYSSNNIISGNTVSNNQYGMLFGYYSNNNQVYNNNFVNNTYPFYYGGTGYGGTGNIFNKAAPVGGNYFSNFHTPAQGCNDANSDGFCDAPYVFSYYGDNGQDNLPWTTQQNSWGAGIPVDTTPPVITYALTPSTPDGASGWYKSNVSLVWSVTDPESTVTKTGCVDQNITADQAATAYACSATSAGGSLGPVDVSIKRDATPPTNVSGAAARLPDHNGWYNTPVGIAFSGQDATSGIASCTSSTFSGPDNAAGSVAGNCTDNAGNAANGSFALMYDASAPSASLSVTAGTAGANGWYTSDVTVNTSGSDAVSGIESCTLDQSQTAETAGSSFDGSCTNGAGLATNASPLTIKLDKTGPSATLSAIGTLGNNGWYVSNVTVNTTGNDSISNATTCTADQFQTTDTSGAAFNGSCTNNAGLMTNAASLTVKVDKTKPTLNPVVSPIPVILNGTATATSGAADALSGLASQSCGMADTSTVGSKSVACSATDNAGNTNNANASYSVIYNWTGFFQPVDNLPILNAVKAGQAIPVKFSLGGNQGLNIMATGYPVSTVTTCGNTATDIIETTVTAGSSSLSYDATSNQYNYVWKTDKLWAGTCRTLTVKFIDGTIHQANFQFTK